MKKNMTRGIIFLFAAFAASALYCEQPARGVAGVDVIVKQNPSKRVVTDARGTFAFNDLAPGSYTLTFRSAKAKDTKTATTDKVTVATSYSINIDGTKRPVKQSGLTSDKLVAGVDVRVEVGGGAKVRGQVAAGALKKMVWIPKEPGSHIPGHWVEADSAEARAAGRNTSTTHSREDMRNMMNRENANMTDPTDPRNSIPGAGR